VATVKGTKATADMAMKIVLNRAVGSCFSLSSAALAKLAELKDRDRRRRDPHGPVRESQFVPCPESGRPDWLLSLARNDGDLVHLVEELGSSAAGPNVELEIVEIPDGRSWKISDVVGYEFVVVNGDVA
jgi:hypothetical protein